MNTDGYTPNPYTKAVTPKSLRQIMAGFGGAAQLWTADSGVLLKSDGTTVVRWASTEMGAAMLSVLGTAPTFEAAGVVNGTVQGSCTKPSIRFGTGKGLRAPAASLLPTLGNGTDNALTVITLVWHDANPSGNEVLWSFSASGSSTQSYIRGYANSSLAYTLDKRPDTGATVNLSRTGVKGGYWTIVTYRFGTTGAVRVNGVPGATDAACANASATTPNQFTLGCDYRGASQGSPVNGNIAACFIAAANLSNEQCLEIETALASWAGLPAPGFVYVSPTGSNSNTGVRASDARSTIASAAGQLFGGTSVAAGAVGVKVTGSTQSAPYRPTAVYDMNKAGALYYLLPDEKDNGGRQYVKGSTKVTGTFTQEANASGVYSIACSLTQPNDRIFLTDFEGYTAAQVAALSASVQNLIQPLVDPLDPYQANPVAQRTDFITAASVTSNTPTAGNPTSIAHTAHGLTTGQKIVISGMTGSWAGLNGAWTVTVTNANAFTVACDSLAFGAVTGTLAYQVLDTGYFAIQNTKLYLRLPGGLDPSAYTWEVPTIGYLVNLQAGTLIVGDFAECSGFTTYGVVNSGTANVAASMEVIGGCFDYNPIGVAASSYFQSVNCYGTKCRFNSNDGFNIHAASVSVGGLYTTDGCISIANLDEGLSGHEGVTLYNRNLITSMNGSGGMDNINNCDGAGSGHIFTYNNRFATMNTQRAAKGLAPYPATGGQGVASEQGQISLANSSTYKFMDAPVIKNGYGYGICVTAAAPGNLTDLDGTTINASHPWVTALDNSNASGKYIAA